MTDAHRIAVVSQKGGVGKTTVALNLSLALAERGWRTLLVDLDPQGGIGHSLAREDTELGGMTELLLGVANGPEVVLKTKLPELHILPRGRLSPADVVHFEAGLSRAGLLESCLTKVGGDYDFVVLDTPAGLGSATRSALRISSSALVPIQAEPLALRTASQVLELIHHVKASENPDLTLLGILPTMVEKSNDPSLSVLIDLWNEVDGVMETTIPRAPDFSLASQKGLPVGYLGGTPSPEARRFDLLAAEVEGRLNRNMRGEEANADRQLL